MQSPFANRQNTQRPDTDGTNTSPTYFLYRVINWSLLPYGVITKSSCTCMMIMNHTIKISTNEWPQYSQSSCEICQRDPTNQLWRPVRGIAVLHVDSRYFLTGAINIQRRLLSTLRDHIFIQNTHLDTVWTQFWRPAFALQQKNSRHRGPRIHCLSTYPSLHIRTIRPHDFTVTARDGRPAESHQHRRERVPRVH